jgi:4-diphosphocytidyl-2-C-methyl-D-erythritol kinase
VVSLAKVNLALAIGPLRDDGYHDLDTVFLAFDPGERVRLLPSPDGGAHVECETEGVPLDESNLALRALRAMETATGEKLALTNRLDKRVPPGTRLGAGSGNAAAVLLGVNQVLSEAGLQPVPSHTLHRLAAELGADVPFLLRGGAARGTGRGDRLEPLQTPDFLGVVVMVPDQRVATADAYGWWDEVGEKQLTRSRPSDILLKGIALCDLSRIAAGLCNDFEEVVAARHSTVNDLKAALLTAGAAGALMTGSGPAVFGLFPSAREARAAAERLTGASGRVFSGPVVERRVSWGDGARV